MVFDEDPSSEESIPPRGPHFIVNWTELVTRTFTLWSRKLIPYLIIASIPTIIYIIIQVVFLWLFFDALALALIGSFGTNTMTILLTIIMSIVNPMFLLVAIPMIFVGVIISGIANGAVIKFALDNYGAPDKGDWRESISFAMSRIVTIVAVQIVAGFIVIACMLPSLLLLIYGAIVYDYMMISYGIFLLLPTFPIGYFLSIRLTPSSAVVIAENHSAIDSLKRAFALSSGNFWHIIAGVFLLGIVLGIIGYITLMSSIPIILLSGTSLVLSFIVSSIVSIVIGASTTPLSGIFYAVLYRDLAEREYGQEHIW